jgi:hypothetical protein
MNKGNKFKTFSSIRKGLRSSYSNPLLSSSLESVVCKDNKKVSRNETISLVNVSTGSIFTKYDKNNEKTLTYYGLMLAGAVARSVSATAVHPLNV